MKQKLKLVSGKKGLNPWMRRALGMETMMTGRPAPKIVVPCCGREWETGAKLDF